MISGSTPPIGPSATHPPAHLPVLLEEAMAGLALQPHGSYVDATFGAGGYSRAILAVEGARVVALDRDPDAVRNGANLVHAEGRLVLREGRFGELGSLVDAPVDGIVFDIGVSSMQIDEADRGFSFRFDGPLDMRMSKSGASASDIVNETEEAALADILYTFGEERASRRIARAIVADRRATPFTTTRQLAELVARVAPAPPTDIHPATRTFQALRIAVNEELSELVRGLEAAETLLRPGGRLAVVTFHSLEDRIVKQFLVARSRRGTTASRHQPGEPAAPVPTFTLVGRQPIVAGELELRANPRARSAKLRVAERTAAPPEGAPPPVRALAELPARHPVSRHSRRR